MQKLTTTFQCWFFKFTWNKHIFEARQTLKEQTYNTRLVKSILTLCHHWLHIVTWWYPPHNHRNDCWSLCYPLKAAHTKPYNKDYILSSTMIKVELPPYEDTKTETIPSALTSWNKISLFLRFQVVMIFLLLLDL